MSVLRELGATVVDLGPATTESVDYPDFAARVGRAVAATPGSRGLLCCGSGLGVNIAANKLHGIRAVTPWDDETARLSRAHNDTNVVCFGERTMDPALSERLLRIWWATPFDGGRHAARVAKIDRLDEAPSATAPPGDAV
jgi:ribose 5-phosphate isomerase B